MSSFTRSDAYALHHSVYSSSKAAVNFAMLGFASQNRDTTSLLVHPRWMKTDMVDSGATDDPVESAASIFAMAQSPEEYPHNQLMDAAGKVIGF